MLLPTTRARARALQLLYAAESRAGTVDAMVPGLACLIGPDPVVLDLAEGLAKAVAGRLAALDRLLAAATEHWRLERLAVIDRNILRIGAHEIESGAAPPKVAIDEAIWLAQRFGTPESPAFVNGVLDRVARNLGRLPEDRSKGPG